MFPLRITWVPLTILEKVLLGVLETARACALSTSDKDCSGRAGQSYGSDVV